MSILSGAINRLLASSPPATVWFANGVAAGLRLNHSPMRPARAHLGVFPPDVRAHVSAIACSLPRQCGVSLARWSRTELARQVAASPGLPCVSASTIGRWLQAEQIRPWRYRMWQHIHDPTAFVARARPILQLYGQARALLASGTWLVCVDEKTSIQAREAEQAPRA